MKRMRIASTVLFLLLLAAFAYASPQQQDEPKSKETAPAMKQPEAKPEAKPESQEQKPNEMKQEKNDQEKQDKNAEKQEEKENKDREKQEPKDERKEDKKSGKGGHIPDDKFRSSFGRSHTFHPTRPKVVGGRPTFVYGGYSFIMVDPWPAEWAYTDDCYIDYIDGEYFLFDLLHPGVRIALFVSM